MLEPQPPELVVRGCKACSEQGRNLRFRRCCCSTDTLQRWSDRNKVPHPSLRLPESVNVNTLQSPQSPMETGHHVSVRLYQKGITHIFISICFIAFITIVTYPPVSAARYLDIFQHSGEVKYTFPYRHSRLLHHFHK